MLRGSLVLNVFSDNLDGSTSGRQDHIASAPEIRLPVKLRQVIRELFSHQTGTGGFVAVDDRRDTDGWRGLKQKVDMISLIVHFLNVDIVKSK